MGRNVLTSCGVLVLLLLLLVGCSAFGSGPTRDDSGQVVEAGELEPFDLRIGDCFNNAGTEGAGGEEEGVDTVMVVPCSELHDYEVYHTFDLADGEYPGVDAIEGAWTGGCLAEFELFVGTSFDQSIFEISAIYPTEATWNEVGDREVICSVTALNGDLREGSARNSRI